MKRLAVYCGSATPEDPRYMELAHHVGETLAQRGIGVVYGGGRLGLMGAVASGALDAGGFLTLKGRSKDVIIRGGVNISPLEIDEVINAHPGVDQGLAVGFANEWYGEEVGAYVRRADPEVTEEALLAALADALPFAKRPKVVVFGDDIPVTSTGKYKRNRLVELFADHRTTQFRDER